MPDTTKYKLPGNFRFPNQKDYAQYTTSALKDVGFDSEFARTYLHTPIQTMSNALIVALESTAAKPIAEISKELRGLTKAIPADVMKLSGKIASLAYNLSMGNTEVAVGIAVEVGTQAGQQIAKQLSKQLSKKTAAAMTSAMATVVPVVGAMISMVVDTIAVYNAGWSEEQKERAYLEAKGRMHNHLLNRCSQYVALHDPSPTGATGITPADMFRGVYVAAQVGEPIPPMVASMYVLLCGGESQSVGLSRRENDFLMNGVRKMSHTKVTAPHKSVPGRDVGVEPHVQQRMWSLIKAIMFATRDPRITEDIIITGDQGRAGFALVQDLVRREIIAGRITREYLATLSQILGSRYLESSTYDCGPYCAGMLQADCREYMFLNGAIIASQRTWQSQLEAEFCDVGPGGRCVWKATPSAAALKQLGARPKTTLLVIPAPHALALADSGYAADARAAGYTTKQKVAIAAGSVLAGGAALFAARRLA